MLVVEFAQLRLGEPRVQLHLVEHRGNTGLVNEILEDLLVEVSNTNGSDLAHPLQAGNGFKGLHVQPALWPRPVDEVQVQVIQLQLLHGFLEGLFRLLRAVVGVPDLGGDKQVLAADIARVNGLVQRSTQGPLVLVQRRRIKVAVAQVNGFADYANAFIVIELVGAQTELGHLAVIIERNSWHSHSSHCAPVSRLMRALERTKAPVQRKTGSPFFGSRFNVCSAV